MTRTRMNFRSDFRDAGTPDSLIEAVIGVREQMDCSPVYGIKSGSDDWFTNDQLRQTLCDMVRVQWEANTEFHQFLFPFNDSTVLRIWCQTRKDEYTRERFASEQRPSTTGLFSRSANTRNGDTAPVHKLQEPSIDAVRKIMRKDGVDA